MNIPWYPYVYISIMMDTLISILITFYSGYWISSSIWLLISCIDGLKKIYHERGTGIQILLKSPGCANIAIVHTPPGVRQINFNPHFPVNIQYNSADIAYVWMKITNQYFFFQDWIYCNSRKVTYLSNTLDRKLILT